MKAVAVDNMRNSLLRIICLVFGGAVALLVAGVLWWTFANPVDAIRYRLTLEAEVDGRHVTGSSVVQVDYRYDYLDFLNIDRPRDLSPIRPMVSGESVVLDMGPRGVLFATLQSSNGPDIRKALSVGDASAERIVPNAWGEPPIFHKKDLARLHQLSRRLTLPFEKLPMLVRFRELADPRTVELVDPDNLAASFGSGVKLVGATIEITNDAITRRLEKTPPWLSGRLIPDAQNDKSPRPSVSSLHYSDFERSDK